MGGKTRLAGTRPPGEVRGDQEPLGPPPGTPQTPPRRPKTTKKHPEVAKNRSEINILFLILFASLLCAALFLFCFSSTEFEIVESRQKSQQKVDYGHPQKSLHTIPRKNRKSFATVEIQREAAVVARSALQ